MPVDTYRYETAPAAPGFLRFKYYFHVIPEDYEWLRFNFIEVDTFDAAADIITRVDQVNEELGIDEIHKYMNLVDQRQFVDHVANHQPQADFDRRMLGRIMPLIDCFVFNDTLNFFREIEIRSGLPPPQRHNYLGVQAVDYELVETRYNEHSGTQSFFDAEELRVWPETPEDWE
jgi:hypothetical protein